jgi:hypothetical protein
MALMIALPLLLLGIAMVLDRYPSWLGWIGLAIGGATMLAAVGLFLIPQPVSRLPAVWGAGLGYRAAMAGGDWDRDAATCSRRT